MTDEPTPNISPDKYMGRSVDSLVFWAARLLARTVTYCKMDPDLLESPEVQKLMETDDQMRVAYLAAIKLRAGEVADYAYRLGIRCTAEQVRKSPFLVCVALMNHIGAWKDDDEEAEEVE